MTSTPMPRRLSKRHLSKSHLSKSRPSKSRLKQARGGRQLLLLALSSLLLTLSAVARAQSLIPSKPAYAPNEAIVVQFSNFPGNLQDWITVVKSTSPPDTWGEWFFTKGSQGGTFTFKGLPAGSYQVRGYFDWPEGGTQIRAQSPLLVTGPGGGAPAPQGPPKLTPSSASYKPDEPIRIAYEGFPGAATEWITVVAKGTKDDQYAEWHYSEGQPSGGMAFGGLPPGEYEARAYFDWPAGAFRVRARAAFQVEGKLPDTASSVRPDRPVYLADEDIDVRYAGFPATGQNWVTIVAKGSPKESYEEWYFSEGAAGRLHFEGLTPGVYEVRAFFDWPNGGYEVRASARVRVVENRKQLRRAGVCADPKARKLMDQWLASAVPPDTGKHSPNPGRYDAWGRVLNERHRHAGRERGRRCEWLWKNAGKLQSKNGLGTLEEYVKKNR